MLSIGRLVPGAEQYYLRNVAQGREEYYTGSGEAPGVWVGRGAARLGLEGTVRAADLQLVLAGYSPEGERLVARRVDPARRVAALDLTFSAPKSVSLLYALGAEDVAQQVRDLHHDAVADAVDYLERRALRVRRGAGGAERIRAEGLVATSFLHRTSRAGDPQLHSHVLVANVALGEDGKWSSPYARLLYHHARTAGFLYQASLRARLTDALGVRFGVPDQGMAEVEGFSPSVLRGFSTRRREIEAHLEAAGLHSPKAAQVATLATRSPKIPPTGGPPDGLRTRWWEKAVELGLGLDTVASLLGRHVREPVTDDLRRTLVDRLVGTAGLTATESAFERRDAVRAVAELLADGATGAEVEAIADLVLEGDGVVTLPTVGRGGERRHTTEALLAVERQAVAGAAARGDAGVAVVAEPMVDAALADAPHLADEQRAMVRHLATSGAGVDVVVGKAGSGKTAALSAARAAWEAAGHQVVGTALSARAAKELQEGAGVESTTIARLLRRIERGNDALGAGAVLVVDEAGMVGTRFLARLLSEAERVGAKVVLVGDHRQLPEIEAGGTFGALARRLGAVSLTENRRQHEGWERQALDQLRHGDVAQALDALRRAGRVVTAPDMAAARKALVERWHQAVAAREDALMLGVTRRDVADLNAEARRVLRESGNLGNHLATYGDRSVAMGEIVVCLRNDAELGVVNGTRGAVESADRWGLVLSTPDGTRWLPASYASTHLDYGYAVTVHKAQGATVDRAFVLATESLTREAGYVAMSRARKGTELFVPASLDEDLDCEDGGVEHRDPLERLVTRLSVSRAKQLTFEDLKPGPLGAVEKKATAGGDRAIEPSPGLPSSPPRPWAEPEIKGSPRGRDALPEYLRRAMGSPPPFADERAEYDRVAGVVSDYRRRYRIEGDDPLGPRPLEAVQRARYEQAQDELRTYERRLGRQRQFFGVDLGF